MSRRKPRLTPAVTQQIETYQPRRIVADREEVDAVMPRVRARVAAAAPLTPKVARILLWAAIRFALWGLQYGLEDDETLWQRHNVDVFVASQNKLQPAGWRHAMRSALQRLGTTVDASQFPPPQQRIGRAGPAQPYEPHEERGFIANALLSEYPQRPARQFVLGASAGAGLSGPAIRAARVEDLVDLHGDRVGVRVEGRYAGVIPVRDLYTKVVREAAEEAGTGRFVVLEGRNGVYHIAAGLTDEGLSLPRARATWLAHLVAQTRLPVLEAVAGSVSPSTLAALAPSPEAVLTPEQAIEEALRA